MFITYDDIDSHWMKIMRDVATKPPERKKLSPTELNEFSLPDEILNFNETKFGCIRNFESITKNIYSMNVEPFVDLNRSLPKCNCYKDSLDEGCGENCLNRLTLIECTSNTCSISAQECTNRIIQNNKTAPTEKFMDNLKGWGIRAKQRILKGSFINEYIGEIIDEKTYKNRIETECSTPHDLESLQTKKKNEMLEVLKLIPKRQAVNKANANEPKRTSQQLRKKEPNSCYQKHQS